MQRFMAFLASQSGVASLLLRLVFAEIVIVGGYRKFFVIGLAGVTTNFEKFGIPLPQIMGPLIGLLELVGGALLAVGLFTRCLGVLFTCEFIVATWSRWVFAGEGYGPARIDTLLAVVALVLATQGAGPISVDAKRGRS
jgi:putative oxidoreductase